MAKTKKELTPAEYAELRGITLQAVTEMIRKKGTLPFVSEIKKFGRFYVLITDVEKIN